MTNPRIQAHAKINLFLRILGQRSDGMHEIETVFQRISLCDEIALEESSADDLIVEESPWPIGSKTDNLVWRVLAAMRREVEFPPVRIHLWKRIPPGAGLGGGSADAGATLRGINQHFALGLDERHLMRIGSQIGADVAFMASSHICAIGRGVGEILDPLEHSVQWPCTVVYPGQPSNTGEAYRAWHDCPAPKSPAKLSDLVTALESGDLDGIRNAVHSDFTASLERYHTGVRDAMNWLKQSGLRAIWPTGSGSAVVALDTLPEGEAGLSLPDGFRCFAASLLPTSR